MAIDYRANYTGQDLNTQNKGYDYISQSPYLQQDFVPNVATFNISPKNYGIMSQYPQYPQYPIIPQEGGDGGGGIFNTKRSGEKLGMAGMQPNFMGGTEGMTEEEIKLMDKSLMGYQPTWKDALGFAARYANPFGGGLFTAAGGSLNSLRKKEKAFQQQIKDRMEYNSTTGRELDAADKAFAETRDYDEYSGVGNTNQTYSTPAPSYSYEGSDEQDRDNENTSTGGRDESDRMAYGGRAGYRDGGLTEYEVFKLGELGYDTKGGKILEPFGGINVLRDILKVNKYAYGGIVGMYR